MLKHSKHDHECHGCKLVFNFLPAVTSQKPMPFAPHWFELTSGAICLSLAHNDARVREGAMPGGGSTDPGGLPEDGCPCFGQ